MPETIFSPLFVFLSILVTSNVVSGIHSCQSEIFCETPILSTIQSNVKGLFEQGDCKRFVDMPLKINVSQAVQEFANLPSHSIDDLRLFLTNFYEPGSDLEDWTPSDWSQEAPFINSIKAKYREFAQGIHNLWPSFGRKISGSVFQYPNRHTLLGLPNGFIVPGGRFREVYYWDTFWIVKGLLLSGMESTVKGMLENYAYLIQQYGYIPNGARLYYEGRSQPPMFTLMTLDYYLATKDTDTLRAILPQMEAEYQFWMTQRAVYLGCSGALHYCLPSSGPGAEACAHRCSNVLNRYSSAFTTPRPESYREDVATCGAAHRGGCGPLYREIAAMAESGWDFCTRWLVPLPGGDIPTDLTRANITHLAPVDLNAVLLRVETSLATLCGVSGINCQVSPHTYLENAHRRRIAINRYLSDPVSGAWADYVFSEQRLRYPGHWYSSTLTPLWAGVVVGPAREGTMLKWLKTLSGPDGTPLLAYPGGLPNSLVNSTQQWDFPNVWAPAVFWAAESLRAMHDPEAHPLAKDIMGKFVSVAAEVFAKDGKMFEKYDCLTGEPGHGGEYTVQDGFGWTNGVTLHFLKLLSSQSAD
eukprot:GCRY01000858.1.p1 GENE.GCRY01000858.1~~GCRY01000858.1.p1  ORF type:complete len:585 (-),score=122.63 GCRY01000858.1:264-2018(-)